MPESSIVFCFKQKTAYEIDMRLEFRRVLFRSADGLNGHARVGALEHGGDAAQRQAFEERVDRRGERRPIRLEDRHQRDDEAAENTAHHPWNGRAWDWRMGQTPGPCGRGHNA